MTTPKIRIKIKRISPPLQAIVPDRHFNMEKWQYADHFPYIFIYQLSPQTRNSQNFTPTTSTALSSLQGLHFLSLNQRAPAKGLNTETTSRSQT